MRTVTAVDPVWLAELGPMFFSIKDDKSDAIDAKQAAKEQARQMEVEFEQKLAAERAIQEQQERDRQVARAQESTTQVAAIGAPAPRDRKPRRVVLTHYEDD